MAGLDPDGEHSDADLEVRACTDQPHLVLLKPWYIFSPVPYSTVFPPPTCPYASSSLPLPLPLCVSLLCLSLTHKHTHYLSFQFLSRITMEEVFDLHQLVGLLDKTFLAMSAGQYHKQYGIIVVDSLAAVAM